jgi:hypothetical protein
VLLTALNGTRRGRTSAAQKSKAFNREGREERSRRTQRKSTESNWQAQSLKLLLCELRAAFAILAVKGFLNVHGVIDHGYFVAACSCVFKCLLA